MTLLIFIFSLVKAHFLSKLLEAFKVFLVLFLRRGCVSSWGKKQYERKNIDSFYSDLLCVTKIRNKTP